MAYETEAVPSMIAATEAGQISMICWKMACISGHSFSVETQSEYHQAVLLGFQLVDLADDAQVEQLTWLDVLDNVFFPVWCAQHREP